MISTQLPPAILAQLRGSLCRTTTLTEAAAWSESKSDRALVLEGGTGSGKTLAAAWAFQFARRRTRPSEVGTIAWPVWCDARLVCAMVGHEWRREAEWRTFDAAPLVVIDDVGIEDDPKNMRALLERLWNVSSGRLVLTTNVSPDEFSSRYGDRVFSRVAGSARWIATTSSDMRIEAPAGEAFRRPEDETSSEQVERLRAEDEASRAAAEWERTRADRERMTADIMRRVSDITGDKRLRAVDSSASDNERREFLRKQLEGLKEGA